MGVPELLWSILDTLTIHNDRRDRNDNDEIQHMRAVEVQRKHLIFQVREEMLPGFSRVTLQLFDRIGHCAVSIARALLSERREDVGTDCFFFMTYVHLPPFLLSLDAGSWQRLCSANAANVMGSPHDVIGRGDSPTLCVEHLQQLLPSDFNTVRRSLRSPRSLVGEFRCL